jgi:hypothetical protein
MCWRELFACFLCVCAFTVRAGLKKSFWFGVLTEIDVSRGFGVGDGILLTHNASVADQAHQCEIVQIRERPALVGFLRYCLCTS